jgi:CRISPR-associated protein Csm2
MTREEIQQWIVTGPTAALINKAEQFGRRLQEGDLTTSQIRQVFTKMKNIESKGIDSGRLGDLLMLKPLISYAAGRNSRCRGLQELKRLVCDGIDQVAAARGDELRSRFKNFVKLFEAVLAYHRASGGK